MLIGLVAAAGLLAGCTGAGAVFHHRDSGVQEIGLPETNPPGGNGGGGAGGGAAGAGAIGGAAGGGDDGGVDGVDASDPWAPTVKAITAGRDYLVAAFPTQAGVIVVRGGHIEIVSRAGASLALITTPRENVAASFDGTQLVVSDRAMLTAYDTSLTELGDTLIGEPCYSIAAFSNRVVCTAYYGAYPFWSYVPRPGDTPVRSPYSVVVSPGIGSLFRVPGRQQFVQTDTGSGNKRLLLLDLSASGTVPDTAASVGEEFVSGTLGPPFVAFDRMPPQRLMTISGNIYRLGSADCITTDRQSCLVPDGKLTPRFGPQEIIVATVGDGAGHILILRTPTYAVQKPLCALGCTFDSLDIASGTIDRTTMVKFSVTQPVSAAYDPVIDGMVLGYQSPDGDAVALVDFSPHTAPVGPGPDPGAGPAPVVTSDSAPSGCAPSKRLYQGQARVLTAAPVPGGLILARDDGFFRMDRAGNVLSMVTRAQPPNAAVFDAGMLAIADAQGLAFYDQSLRLLREIPVTDGCQNVSLLSAVRAVCDNRDPMHTSAGTLRTYAVDSGALLATSPVDGMWAVASNVRRVPGVEALVSEENFTYLLYGAAPGGAVSFVNTSPMQGIFLGGLPFTLWGSGRSGTPPVHLVTWSGSLLKIYNPDCLATGTAFDAGCFLPDGELGTQVDGQVFVAMVNDGTDDLYAVALADNLASSSIDCTVNPCHLVQHIDIPSRRVISSRVHSFQLGEVAMIAHDAECGMLLVSSAHEVVPVDTPEIEYDVDLVDYGAP